MKGSADVVRYKNQIDDNRQVLSSLIKDKQYDTDRNMELIQMISNLRAEVNELKKSKK